MKTISVSPCNQPGFSQQNLSETCTTAPNDAQLEVDRWIISALAKVKEKT